MQSQKKHLFSAGVAVTAVLCICGTMSAIGCTRTENTAASSPTAEITTATTRITTAVQTTALPESDTAYTTETAATVPDDGWMLTLVNSTHPLPDHYPDDIELVTLSNGTAVDARIYPALQEMFDDMRAEGIYPTVREGFRTHEDQEEILQTRIQSYITQGFSADEAESLARQYVAEPGTSEHELGLAVDINAAADGGSTPDAVYGWLAQNAYRYGFILRYPDGKSEITGIQYEPWHYRYVGTDAAAEIYLVQITLEEYLGAE